MGKRFGEAYRGNRPCLDSYDHGQWDLTVFTCTPGGQTGSLVRCDRMA